MGIALSALSMLPAPLRALSRWFQQNLQLEPQKPDSRALMAVPSQPSNGNPSPRHNRAGSEAAATTHRPAVPNANRPLRGNWPFNVKPPLAAPDGPAGPLVAASRSFLPNSPMGSRDSFFASLSSQRSNHPSARVLRRVSDVGTGKLVIAGRMADVCAELDRMAALEGLQAQ